MTAPYTHRHGNARRSGFINGIAKASGDIAWSRPIAEGLPDPARPRFLLSAGNMILVDGDRQIYAFSSDARRLWLRPKWPGSEVILKDEAVYFIAPSAGDNLQAVDLNNNPKIRPFSIPDIGEDAWLVSVEPVEKGLVAQIQFASQPDFPTCEVMVYRTAGDRIGYAWVKNYPGKQCPVQPIICTEQKRLVTSLSNGMALVFDIDSGEAQPEPLAQFPLPHGAETKTVSGGDEGTLYWLGFGESGMGIRATNFAGEPIWEWAAPKATAARPIAPAMITSDRIYLLTGQNLTAIQKGNLLWNHPAADRAFRFGTALADNSILVAAGDLLFHISDAGDIIFETKLDLPAVTAPVIDHAGLVYIADEERLYAID